MSYHVIRSAAVTALLLAAAPLSAQQTETRVEVARAGAYPVNVPVFTEVAPSRIGCTQLERSAGVEPKLCGTMLLHEVVRKLNPSAAD